MHRAKKCNGGRCPRQVDGVLLDLPFSHGDLVTAFASGAHGVLRTAFDLSVTFDWQSHARVLLPAAYAGAVCGLCGDADGDAGDDFAGPDGRQAPDADALGRSWQLGGAPGCTSGCGAGGCPGCSAAELRLYRGDKHCGVLGRAAGPLAACYAVLDPAPFRDDCLHDACRHRGHRAGVCGAVAAYVAECQRHGVALRPWRSAAFCSPQCPPHSHYELCGPGCPATCAGLSPAPGCEAAPCAEGCVCDAGYVRGGTACVPPARCGCLHRGRYHAAGSEFVPCPRCTERCVCNPGGSVECRPGGCGPGEECAVRDGLRGCFPAACRRCEWRGAGGLRALDGRRSRLSDGCGFLLAEVAAAGDGDGDGDEEAFAVRVERERGGLLSRVLVTALGYTVAMSQEGGLEVTVDGERHLPPLALARGRLGVTRAGATALLRGPGGLRLLFVPGASYALLTLPVARASRVRGLCGDTGDTGGDKATDAWKTPGAGDGCGDGCGDACTRCNPATPSGCSLMADAAGPFGGCHRVVAPGDYVAGCAREACGAGDGSGDDAGTRAAVCRGLQGYAAACQAAGAELREWREEAACPLPCPAHSHYALCSRSCGTSCAGLSAADRCSPKCFEGCECDAGFLASGARCVPADACGCWHRGRYFEIATTVLSEDCTESCTCRAAGGVSCQRRGCPFGQACVLRGGTRGCAEQPGLCALAPGSRFVTFDGAAGPGVPAGVYEVAAVCDGAGAAWFRVVVAVGEDPREDHAAVAALHLFTRGPFVTVRRSKKVWVNGMPTTVPAKASETLTITESQSGDLVIEEAPTFVVRLSPRGEMTVAVPTELGGRLCGACGNYNGDSADDLRLPGERWVDGVEELLQAWKAPDLSLGRNG
ncbi:IgGFc-binding protein-like [Dromaius novaehollandiae]|uniref:IgGFc-binding protein-like n=1 Tax=Dromaius novaehollandiae TaxID=8790 RepID=UPI0031202C5D